MNREEFETLVLVHLDDVMAYARRLSGSASDAEDLVQGAYERAFRSWRTLREPGACRGWLFQILRRHWIDEGRRAEVRKELQLVDGEEDSLLLSSLPARTFERIDAFVLETALASLPHEQREALLLHDLWRFTYSEIAGIVGIPVGTVCSRIERGRARMTSMLSTEERRAGEREKE